MSIVNSKDYINKRVFYSGSKKLLGKISAFVYYEKKCVGLIVKRPDLLLMFHRKHVFVPLDNIKFKNSKCEVKNVHKIVKNPHKNKNCNFSWEKTPTWEGAPILYAKKTIGYTDNVTFNKHDGYITNIEFSSGKLSGLILGKTRIKNNDIIGYSLSRDAIVLNDNVSLLEEKPGIAQKAGESSSIIIHKIKKSTPGLSKDIKNKSNTAIDVMQKQSDKIQKSFKEFKEEFKKGLND